MEYKILAFTHTRDKKSEEYEIISKDTDKIFIADENRYQIPFSEDSMTITMYTCDDDVLDNVSVYRNGELLEEFGTRFDGVSLDKKDFIEHIVSEYVNLNAEYLFKTVSDEITDIETYYDFVRNETLAAKSGKGNPDLPLYVDLCSSCILPLDIETKQYIGYTDGDRFIMLDKEKKSLITDYQNFYESIIHDVVKNPNENILYMNTDVSTATKYLEGLTEGNVRCQMDFAKKEVTLKLAPSLLAKFGIDESTPDSMIPDIILKAIDEQIPYRFTLKCIKDFEVSDEIFWSKGETCRVEYKYDSILADSETSSYRRTFLSEDDFLNCFVVESVSPEVAKCMCKEGYTGMFEQFLPESERPEFQAFGIIIPSDEFILGTSGDMHSFHLTKGKYNIEYSPLSESFHIVTESGKINVLDLDFDFEVIEASPETAKYMSNVQNGIYANDFAKFTEDKTKGFEH